MKLLSSPLFSALMAAVLFGIAPLSYAAQESNLEGVDFYAGKEGVYVNPPAVQDDEEKEGAERGQLNPREQALKQLEQRFSPEKLAEINGEALTFVMQNPDLADLPLQLYYSQIALLEKEAQKRKPEAKAFLIKVIKEQAAKIDQTGDIDEQELLMATMIFAQNQWKKTVAYGIKEILPLWMNANWEEYPKQMNRVGISFLKCLQEVANNYRQAVAQEEDGVEGDGVEGDGVEGETQEVDAQAELDRMFAELNTTSSSSSSSASTNDGSVDC